jgi:hypothetical protein
VTRARRNIEFPLPSERVSELDFRAEKARQVMLRNLGFLPLISRYDPPGAKKAKRFLPPIMSHKPRADEKVFPAPTVHKDENPMNLSINARDANLAQDLAQPRAEFIGGKGSNGFSSEWADRASFSLVISEDIAWVENLDDQLLKREKLLLIAAMARAIRGPKTQSQHQEFKWSLLEQQLARRNGGALSEMFGGFLQRLILDNSIKHLICLGSNIEFSGVQLQIYTIPSTFNMLNDGKFKRLAWSILKPLRNV